MINIDTRPLEKEWMVMTTDDKHLGRLLTAQLAAVSQQFFHILNLKHLGESQLAARLVQVDDADFKNAMQIIDLMTASNAPILVGEHRVAPGASVPTILQSELKMELELKTIIESTSVTSAEGHARIIAAAAPRRAYQEWLKTHIAALPKPACPPPGEMPVSDVLPNLLLMMEQTLIHAFVRWHQGDADGADTAWQMSGAAMLYLTALAPYCATDEIAPKGLSVPHMRYDGRGDSFLADIALVHKCADAAHSLANRSDVGHGGGGGGLRTLCQQISHDCKSIAMTRRGRKIKASLGASKAFTRFGPVRERMCCQHIA